MFGRLSLNGAAGVFDQIRTGRGGGEHRERISLATQRELVKALGWPRGFLCHCQV